MSADPRFYPSAGRLSLADICAALGITTDHDEDRIFTGIGPLHLAGADEVSFMEGKRYLGALKASKAGAVIVSPDWAEHVPTGCIPIIHSQAQAGYAKIASLFHPPPVPRPGIHPTAFMAPDAKIGANCEIGAFVFIGPGAEIGPECIIENHASIGPGCKLGAHGRIRAHASMMFCLAGDRVVLHPGARVGNEGFGFITTAQGAHVTTPQLGRVIIGDDVEIGANACIDRGAGGDTVLGPGTRIDNLVQIGHNVVTGRGAVIVALAGIAGSVTIGDYAVLAGQVGVAGHLSIGAKARIGAQAGVTNDVPAGTDMLGSPAWPVKETMRAFARLRRLGSTKGNEKTG